MSIACTSGSSPINRASGPPRRRCSAACGWVAAASQRPPGGGGAAAAGAAPRVTPLPLLPFWQEFRAQVARLEGVQALPTPPHLEAQQSTSPPVSVRSGSCHADRLRFGNFLYTTIGSTATRGRGSGRGSLSLLQGTLFPTCFSYHPPLVFQAAAFDGGESWMLSVDYVAILPEQQQQQQRWQQQGDKVQWQRWQQQGDSSSGGRSSSSNSGAGSWRDIDADSSSGSSRSSGGGAAAEAAAVLTPEAWQQQQLQRLAAVREMHRRAAVPLPPTFFQQPAAAWLSPAHCLLSSAQLVGAGVKERKAALESIGLPAFRAALSVHLNGLAMAPADASPQHVQRMAAAQQRYLATAGRHPLLCSAQLAATFGQEWLDELQDHMASSSQHGLADILAPLPEQQQQQEEQRRWEAQQQQQQEQGQRGQGKQQQQQQQQPEGEPAEFVYFDPRQLMQQQGEG